MGMGPSGKYIKNPNVSRRAAGPDLVRFRVRLEDESNDDLRWTRLACYTSVVQNYLSGSGE